MIVVLSVDLICDDAFAFVKPVARMKVWNQKARRVDIRLFLVYPHLYIL